MNLKKYHAKRNFAKTSEPKGKLQSKKTKNLLVVQKHAASHLHYDLRLEMHGVLKSWAIPKGPSLDPTIKRLAVHVEDHPLEYGSFEGTIPKGEYGGGTVMLWDKGGWHKIENGGSYDKGNFTFLIKAKKLKGLWKLVQIKRDPKNWLLIKLNDEYAISEKKMNILENDLSVKTKKTMLEIEKGIKKNKSKFKNKEYLNYPKIDSLPKSIKPQLTQVVKSPPQGDSWLHEMKFDGYRLLCMIDGKIKLVTRGEQDWTDKFPLLVKEIKKLKLKKTILDGEIVAIDKQHRISFQALQNSMNNKQNENISLIYFVFDLIYYQGVDLSQMELIKRKEILKNIFSNSSAIRYSDHVIGKGDKVFKKACQLGFEGIVSKKIDSHYTQGRTKNWCKSKCIHLQEFIVGGYTQPEGTRSYFGSLLLGYFNAKHQLTYCGHVGTGFNQKSLKEIYDELKKHTILKNPFQQNIQEIKNKNKVSWVKPKLVVEVKFKEWTQDNILRQPSFNGRRIDISPKDVSKESYQKRVKK